MLAIYHLHARILPRQAKNGERRSIVAKAAYRSGQRLWDEHNQCWWNFEHKFKDYGVPAAGRAAYRSGGNLKDEQGRPWNFEHKSGVAHSEISLPEHAPVWMGDRQRLWNAVDKAEKRCDAQL